MLEVGRAVTELMKMKKTRVIMIEAIMIRRRLIVVVVVLVTQANMAPTSEEYGQIAFGDSLNFERKLMRAG